ncbi:MAG: PspC domain-containing protein [Spirochaetes bacterium GWD1_61_31]|nr:MAG: PspC domain-containing protein [Spirochaetes bacterium GWB1_60_80]OHD33705.1 MAG: PspC domain-containing protein [Spirochaetes bacterium GWC1_61_12]OHD37307.1 MAG: PspC domain-containing protein [Spirochaetes bacterium GWD1_61_31]OHD44962.1 MAG: PspC domain-containing protein [Spirochaetes bacterium GWE1_60_18]OHD60071.1 MAG: PspC domain-containing protein [Spirochaetes bacterium GWF1_60_12]HAP43633.1 PspC domain-containing protein [Spirochaetaceae bacterium]
MSIKRTSQDKLVGGVCGGIARELGWKAGTVRLLFALAVVLGGLSLWVYLIAWFLIPSDAA